MDDTLADIVTTCLQRIEAGSTLDACLAAYPAERAQLEPMLRVATRLRALPRPTPLPAAVQATITSRVLQQLRQPTITGESARPQPGPAPRRLDPATILAGTLRALGYRGPLARPWLHLGVLALALVLAVGLAATAYAAVRALSPLAPASGPTALVPATTFDLHGPIEAVSSSTLVINGITIDFGTQTSIAGTPLVGATAHASGQIRDDGTLLANSVTVDAAAPDQTSVSTEAPVAVATTAPSPSPAPPQPTTEPAPPVEPTVAPAAPAPADGEPFTRLRRLLEAGRADGRAGPEGNSYLAKLDTAEVAFARGDTKKAGDQLRDLYQKLRDKAREGKSDPGFAQEAQALIAEIEATYGIRAIPDEERGGGNDTKDEKDPKDDKGK